MQLLARRYDTGEPVVVRVAGTKLESVRRTEVPAGAPGLPWIAPGFVDVQVNGYGGMEFASDALTVEQVASIAEAYAAFGVTRFSPTITTQSAEVFEHALRTIAAARRERPELARRIGGAHLEGPWISREDGARGAHPLEHCRAPSGDEFQRWFEAAEGRIELVTLAPELPGAIAMIEQLAGRGIVVAIGHTAADGATIRAAAEAGARLSTHLGNGAHRELRRHPNYLWDQLAEDRLQASLIVDGWHLPPEVVQTFVRAKTAGRCLLVSDLSGHAGRPAGRYPSMGGEVEVLPDGRLVIAGQRQLLAGASAPIGRGVANVMRFAGLSLGEAIELATGQPARLLGLPEPRLAPGAEADLVLFALPDDLAGGETIDRRRTDRPGLDVQLTVAGGKVVYASGERVER
jgi:N-acetylglucosamine-6-phosphate deacetylase